MTFKDHFASWICKIGAVILSAGILGLVSLKLCVGFDLCCFSFQGRWSPSFSRVQLSEEASLHYIHSSETLTLTLNHTAEHLLEADIKLFRKYFWDRAFLVKVCTQWSWHTIMHASENAGINFLLWEQCFLGVGLFFNETLGDMKLETALDQ